MNESEIAECFTFIKALTRKCGEVLLEGIKDSGVVELKEDYYDLVTIYDGKIERMLMDGIRERYPDHRFIAEEESSVNKEIQRLTEAPTWILDPIDGTVNFVHRLNLVVISVALAINKELVLGIIYNPCLNEFFEVQKGHGAFLNGSKITVSAVTEMNKALFAHEISLATASWAFEKNIERIKAFVRKAVGMRSLGSAALTLAYIAQGSIDAYNVEDLKPWDIAAGALLIQEAGGVVIDKTGGAYNIMKPDIIVAGTEELAQKVLEIVQEIDRKLEGKLKETSV
jgi:myo-inositol-1(or 4)-monophosphatase